MNRVERYILSISRFAAVACASVCSLRRQSQLDYSGTIERSRMVVKHSFQTLFAVPMTCDGCVKDVSDSLHRVSGVAKVDANLEHQLVSIEGTAPPSVIVEAIQATGRDAILRGSGASDSAAVSILEIYHHPSKPEKPPGEDREVRGLARLVQVSPTATLVDLTLKGVAPGRYRATIRAFGDLKHGVSSTGPLWAGSGDSVDPVSPRGAVGFLEVGDDGRGSAFLYKTFQIWEVIGHAFAVSRQDESSGAVLQNDENTVVGVIARSAGMWDNDKTVCSCTGKTLWEERKDELSKGML